jgi:hypothetical protein
LLGSSFARFNHVEINFISHGILHMDIEKYDSFFFETRLQKLYFADRRLLDEIENPRLEGNFHLSLHCTCDTIGGSSKDAKSLL